VSNSSEEGETQTGCRRKGRRGRRQRRSLSLGWAEYLVMLYAVRQIQHGGMTGTGCSRTASRHRHPFITPIAGIGHDCIVSQPRSRSPFLSTFIPRRPHPAPQSSRARPQDKSSPPSTHHLSLGVCIPTLIGRAGQLTLLGPCRGHQLPEVAA
jgi:hypothetical protein